MVRLSTPAAPDGNRAFGETGDAGEANMYQTVMRLMLGQADD